MEKKHIIGLLVEDQPGVMERISGLFARRGFNIDTITVGKTAQKGISHIIVSLTADEKTLEQVEKQVNKLIDVVKIVDLNSEHSVVREHCLIKVSSNQKTTEEILKFVKLGKGKALNVNHESIIVEVVGEPKKVDNFIDLMKPYGIKEMSRSGINAMQRGNGKQ